MGIWGESGLVTGSRCDRCCFVWSCRAPRSSVHTEELFFGLYGRACFCLSPTPKKRKGALTFGGGANNGAPQPEMA